ncbi:helix-turn-helix transcriptional regulator [Tenggerimyces flavus]|uniref:Helix-turn-helix transcriptional regulator n=1 Tax=Tenggerimyces flavus TaxID=1708749 RepID=A0ABV7Y8K4_9ACTN|nr:helix-turn-helix transcriptional regulator [Tenggerimyces flavus]MBM7783641.1 transcriptional regulator with XRE-family HTH domain [Tenggerimyces flavus]
MDRTELADFLRSRRTRLHPADVGLPSGSRRRTPGLRREEVATLAAMSIDYYVRLEQARAPQPSPQVLASLARALRLTDTERDHLYLLAGHGLVDDRPATDELRPAVRRLLDQLDETPALVVNRLLDMLACNRLYAELAGIEYEDLPDRNAIWLRFCNPLAVERFPVEDFEEIGRNHVAYLRGLAVRRPHDTALTELVTRLRNESREFADLWERHDVDVEPSVRKRIRHQEFGVLDLTCETVLVPDTDQQLVLYTAPEGTPTAAALAELRRRTLTPA